MWEVADSHYLNFLTLIGCEIWRNGTKLPVPLPQSLRAVSGGLGLGGGTFPHLCVC